jgi:hypothetical protein
VNLLAIMDYPQIGFVDGCPLPYGQYAFAVARGDSIRLARDPIGCNKLFFGINSAEQPVAGNRACGSGAAA